MARTAAVWNPAQYLRFAGERLRPALDLLAQYRSMHRRTWWT